MYALCTIHSCIGYNGKGDGTSPYLYSLLPRVLGIIRPYLYREPEKSLEERVGLVMCPHRVAMSLNSARGNTRSDL